VDAHQNPYQDPSGGYWYGQNQQYQQQAYEQQQQQYADWYWYQMYGRWWGYPPPNQPTPDPSTEKKVSPLIRDIVQAATVAFVTTVATVAIKLLADRFTSD
jgi:hypothetical protein